MKIVKISRWLLKNFFK